MATVLITGFALFGAGMGLYLGIISNAELILPEEDFVIFEYRTSLIINGHTGEEMHTLHAGHNHRFAPLSQMPDHLINAFIAIEDERFFEHNGIDIRGIGRAINTIISTGGARTEGASTITQQLIKNIAGHFESDVVTKLQEQYQAVMLERWLTDLFREAGYENPRDAAKRHILELYLNMINLGRQNYGVQAAALFYFGVDVSELTIAQSAAIASITQNPSRFPPDTRPHSNWVRTQLVLDNMLRLNLSPKQNTQRL